MTWTRRMCAEAKKCTDGWTFEENWRFIDLLHQESKVEELGDVQLLTRACHRIATTMTEMFGRRFSLQSMKYKLEQMRKRHNDFVEFLETPGVRYDASNCEAAVDARYWRVVTATGEPETFRRFRKNGDPFHVKLTCIFETEGVGAFPVDLNGSPQCPINIRDSNEDEMALVPFEQVCVLKPIPFDVGNEIVPRDVEGGSGSSSTLKVDDGMFGKSLWEVD